MYGWMKCKARFLVAAAAALLVSVLAGHAGAVPPVLPAIDFPIDTGSIGTVIATAGGAILIIVFGVTIGFALVRKLFHRVKNAV